MESANKLIESLPRAERRRFLGYCESVALEQGVLLCEVGQKQLHAHFPTTGILSLVVTLPEHLPLEMGLIGNEGMSGMTLILDKERASMRAVVHGAGRALRISAQDLRDQLARSPRLLSTLQRYLSFMLGQIAQTAACTHFHEIEPRLARWLLLTHDRAQSDHFHLTHEMLGDMLGVRRSGVTIAAGALQQRNLISYSRGEIRVVDRQGLEAAACSCYAAMTDDYAGVVLTRRSAPGGTEARAVGRVAPAQRPTRQVASSPSLLALGDGSGATTASAAGKPDDGRLLGCVPG